VHKVRGLSATGIRIWLLHYAHIREAYVNDEVKNAHAKQNSIRLVGPDGTARLQIKQQLVTILMSQRCAGGAEG
jgi:hypothetical protein